MKQANKEAVRGLGLKLLGGLKEHEQALVRQLLEDEQHLAKTLADSLQEFREATADSLRDFRETTKQHEESLESLIAFLGLGASIGVFSATTTQQSLDAFIPIDCPKAGRVPCLAYSFFNISLHFVLGFTLAGVLVWKFRKWHRQSASEPLAKKLQGKPVVVVITADRCSAECKNIIGELRELKEQSAKFHLQYFDVTNYLDDLDESNEYDLNLISLARADNIPNKGERLVIVAKIGNSYHARIFDDTGNIVIDKGNREFLPDKMLIRQLDKLLSSQPNSQTKSELIQKITLSFGHNVSAQKYDLNLMSCNSTANLQTKGKALVIVAKIGNSYHTRIFDDTGNKVIDEGNGDFLSEKILVRQLDKLLSSQPNSQEKSKPIQKITSSLGPKASSKKAEALGLSSFFEANKNKPGTVAIIDPETGHVLEEFNLNRFHKNAGKLKGKIKQIVDREIELKRRQLNESD